jgi:hypothetical protein
MARPTPKTSADYTFGVSQVPLYTRFNGREVASGYYSNQRTDSGHTVGVTSEKYGLVKNSELVDIAREGFKANGLKDSIEFEWNNPKREEDKARNLFNLYNATTAHLTSDVAQSRWEYAQKVDRGVLGRLSQAARDPVLLDTLLLPIKKEEAVTVTE